MRRRGAITHWLLGSALASIAGGLLAVVPAEAQQAWGDLSIARPKQQPVRPAKRPPTAEIVDDTAAMPAAPEAPSAKLPDEPADTSATPSSQARRHADQPIKREVGSGDLDDRALNDLGLDGHVYDNEQPVVDGGVEGVQADPRLPSDKAAFLTPPAGYDALAFQIELDPQKDPRPSRLTALEPFEPVGRRAGSWVVFPTVEIGANQTSNVYKSSNARPDFFFDARSTLLAVTDWQQHALQLKVTGAGSAYSRFATENEKTYGVEARGRLDISRRSNIELLVSHSLDDEPRSSLEAPTDAKRPTPYATDKVAVAFNQRFNRLSIQLRGTATDVDYQPVETTAGGVLSNDERDMSMREAAFRAAWAFSPALSVFAETAVNSQRYRVVPGDGISRDSSGDRAKLGLSFGTQSQVWRGEIAAGYGHQNARDPLLQGAKGVIVEANLGWKPTKITSVLFKASTDFTTSTDPGQGNAIERTVGVELRHALQHRLTAIAGLSYQVTDYQGITLVERTTTAELGFEYALSKQAAVLGRYAHSIQDSTKPDGGATTDSVRLAFRYRP